MLFTTILTGLLAATSMVEGKRTKSPFKIGKQITFRATTPGYTSDYLALQSDGTIVIAPISSANTSAVQKSAYWKVTAPLDTSANGCVSFLSVGTPNTYIRNYAFKLLGNTPDGSTQFKEDATYCPQTGLTGKGTWSIQSSNYPTRYFRHFYKVGYIACNGCDTANYDTSHLFTDDASFKILGKFRRRQPTPRDLEGDFDEE